MNALSSAIAPRVAPLSSVRTSSAGLGWGLLGVLIFSFTVPLTRVAVAELSPLFISTGRAVIAGVLASIVLIATRQRIPDRGRLLRLGVVAIGVTAGFPVLTSFALQYAPAAHGAVVVGLLPAATAVLAVIRGRERPSRLFWVAAVAGVLAVLAFVTVTAGGLGGFGGPDLLLLVAVLLGAVGYAEGGLLAREIGAWQTICWALVLALPVMLVVTAVDVIAAPPAAGAAAWGSLAYMSVFSMFLGFFAWYRGLGIGPIATVGQIQLVQPVLSISWAGLLLGEVLTVSTWVGGTAVIVCAALAVRARVRT